MKTKTLLTTTAFLVKLFLSLNAFGTAQISEIIIWRGDTLGLNSLPLELKTDYKSLIVKIHNEIEKLMYPEGDDGEERADISSSVCSRGYRAEWIVINDSVFLNGIYHCDDRNMKVNLSNIFPNIGKNQRVFASWINGELNIPQGEIIEWVNRGFLSIFERETVINVENGIIKNYENYHNRIEKKGSIWLSGFIYRNINWDILPDLGERHIMIFVRVQPNEQGQLESIDFDENHTGAVSAFIFSEEETDMFMQESIRIAKLIPDWDVIYRRGEIIKQSIMIEFSEWRKNRGSR